MTRGGGCFGRIDGDREGSGHLVCDGPEGYGELKFAFSFACAVGDQPGWTPGRQPVALEFVQGFHWAPGAFLPVSLRMHGCARRAGAAVLEWSTLLFYLDKIRTWTSGPLLHLQSKHM